MSIRKIFQHSECCLADENNDERQKDLSENCWKSESQDMQLSSSMLLFTRQRVQWSFK